MLLMLATSLVEVAHFCEFSGTAATTRQAHRSTPQRATSAICDICAASHQTSIPTVTSLSITVAASVSTPLVAVHSHWRLKPFAVDVRPPPAFAV
jgi:hypothetical protein